MEIDVVEDLPMTADTSGEDTLATALSRADFVGPAVTPIRRLLVANRGEIATRIFATAREIGIVCIGVFSDPDRNSVHANAADLAVHLPGVTSAQTYLQGEQIIAAALRTGADAIHPGYGFLAENPDFARQVGAAGLTWVGPAPEAIEAMALKVEAKRTATSAGVPLVPGAEIPDTMSADEVAVAADGVGFPLMVKASAGGGGKGMRIVPTAAELPESLKGAAREAIAAFGDGTVFLERYLPEARHVEVQVFGDAHGNYVHLLDRECSIQRRHQKVIEEAPSPGATPATRDAMFAAAVSLAAEIGYVGAGTVEYLVYGEGAEQEFYFLEMNTRLQVEHRVTEGITGVDLVAWQLEAAQGRTLVSRQGDMQPRGHSIECRLYAEDPANDYLPGAGTLTDLYWPQSDVALIDTGYQAGDEISSNYDPLIAKLVTTADSRDEAIQLMASALAEVQVAGLATNREMLLATLAHPSFRSGDTTTAFLTRYPEVAQRTRTDLTTEPLTLVAAALAQWTLSGPGHSRFNGLIEADPVPIRYRNVVGTPGVVGLRNGEDILWMLFERVSGQIWRFGYSIGDEAYGGERHDLGEIRVAQATPAVGVQPDHSGVLVLERDGLATRFVVSVGKLGELQISSALGTELYKAADFEGGDETAEAAGGPVSPVPGTVVTVEVTAGQEVAAGDTLVVLEAMKMEHRIIAEADGTVSEVLVSPGQSVDAHQLLVSFDETESPE
jgi:propionyl-CoA carboxylase alpha chain